jgi:ABC-type siderophore export system fused ATPase/permease subunit
MSNNQQVHMQVRRSIIISLATCMFRPHIVAIFRKVFFERILHRTLEKYTNIKSHVLGTRCVLGGLHVTMSCVKY